jgi:hypothetical protein
MLYDLGLDPRLQPQRGLRRLVKDELSGDFAPWRFDSYGRAKISEQGIQLLKRQGLAMYVDEMGFYRVGFTNARHQHGHDRWLFRTSEPPAHRLGSRRGSLTWVILHPAHSRADTMGVGFEGSLVDELFYYESSARRVQVHGDTSVAAGLRQMRLLGVDNFDRLLDSGTILKSNLNLTVAHELLYHWEEWLKRHDDMADMPRELVLRMHGLGPVLDAGIELNGYAR